MQVRAALAKEAKQEMMGEHKALCQQQGSRNIPCLTLSPWEDLN
jgi:hypothetical protein